MTRQVDIVVFSAVDQGEALVSDPSRTGQLPRRYQSSDLSVQRQARARTTLPLVHFVWIVYMRVDGMSGIESQQNGNQKGNVADKYSINHWFIQIQLF